MPEPMVVVDAYDPGEHNRGASAQRVADEGMYRDCSTVCVRPVRLDGHIHAKVVQSWENLAAPMNQAFIRMTPIGLEVGAAYSQIIDQILATPGIQDFKFLLTLETDNLPPPDGLLRLLAAMAEHPEYDAIGGLYWTKGPGGQPMIYGDPHETPFNFRPQPPVPGQLVECRGLGMGFTLFRMDLFKDERLPRPLFQTVQSYGVEGSKAYTQDLWFFENAGKLGHRFACHCGVTVGHYDEGSDVTW